MRRAQSNQTSAIEWGTDAFPLGAAGGGLLGLWKPSADLTILLHDNIEWWAGQLEMETPEVKSCVLTHEEDHRGLLQYYPMLSIFRASALNLFAFLDYPPSSAYARGFFDSLLKNAIAAKRLHFDIEPVAEALAVFHGKTSPDKNLRRFTCQIENALLGREAKSVLSAIEDLASWSRSQGLAQLLTHFAFRCEDPDLVKCVNSLPLEYSVVNRFWLIYDVFEALNERRPLKLRREAKILGNFSKGLRLHKEIYYAVQSMVVECKKLTGLAVARPEKYYQKPMPGFEHIIRSMPLAHFARTGRPVDPTRVTIAACVRGIYSEVNGPEMSVIVRPDLSPTERVDWRNEMLAKNLVDQILTTQDVECFAEKHGMRTWPCARGCQEKLMPHARRWRDHWDEHDTPLRKKWEGMLRSK